VIILEFIAAMVVLLALGAAGALGGIWRAAGVARRHADRIGVSVVRGGLLVERFRLPVLMWALAAFAVGVLATAAARDAGLVQVAFFAGAATGVVGLVLIPYGVRRLTGGR